VTDIIDRLLLVEKTAILGLFFFIFIFLVQMTVSNWLIEKFADDWIQTAEATALPT